MAEEEVYTRAEAQRRTGFSATKFNYARNKQLLEALGAENLDQAGKRWRIPRSALIELGWLNPDGTPVTAHGRRTSQGTRVTASGQSRSPLERYERDVIRAHQEVEHARAALAAAEEKHRLAVDRLREAQEEEVVLREAEIAEAQRIVEENMERLAVLRARAVAE